MNNLSNPIAELLTNSRGRNAVNLARQQNLAIRYMTKLDSMEPKALETLILACYDLRYVPKEVLRTAAIGVPIDKVLPRISTPRLLRAFNLTLPKWKDLFFAWLETNPWPEVEDALDHLVDSSMHPWAVLDAYTAPCLKKGVLTERQREIITWFFVRKVRTTYGFFGTVLAWTAKHDRNYGPPNMAEAVFLENKIRLRANGYKNLNVLRMPVLLQAAAERPKFLSRLAELPNFFEIWEPEVFLAAQTKVAPVHAKEWKAEVLRTLAENLMHQGRSASSAKQTANEFWTTHVQEEKAARPGYDHFVVHTPNHLAAALAPTAYNIVAFGIAPPPHKLAVTQMLTYGKAELVTALYEYDPVMCLSADPVLRSDKFRRMVGRLLSDRGLSFIQLR